MMEPADTSVSRVAGLSAGGVKEDMVNVDIQEDFQGLGTPTLSIEDITLGSTSLAATVQAPLPSLHAQAPATGTNERRGYFRRRLDLWDTPVDEEGRTMSRTATMFQSRKFEAGSVSTLPIPVQVGFRRKMLSIFAMQLLLLTGCMVLLTYVPALKDLMHDAFEERLFIVLALGVMMAFLGLLYFTHAIYPLNWVVLLLFTVVLSVFFGSLQVLLNTHAGVFCCTFTFCAICLMVVLSGVKRRAGQRVVLLSSSVAGFTAFAVMAIASGILYAILEQDFISSAGLGYSILLEFVLIMWFSYDASTMYGLISPDEYMNGVIYFYTDLIVLAIISLFFGAVILFCSACGTASGFGYCDFYACMHARGDDDDIEGDGGPIEVAIDGQPNTGPGQ